MPRERSDDRGIELRARVRVQLGERGRGAPRLAVGPVHSDRLERVRDEDDPRAERDLLAREPVRVARSVEVLVVVEDPVVDRLDAEAVEQGVTELRMPADDGELVLREPARCAQDGVGRPIFPRSCRRPPSRSRSTVSGSSPSSIPIASESEETISEWLAVDGSRASTKRTRFFAARRRASRSVARSSSSAE